MAANWVTARLSAKFFSQGIDSATFREQLAAVTLRAPDIKAAGDYDVIASTHIGELSSGIRVAKWAGAKPTVIYHHGTGERPFDASFRRAFPPGDPIDANLIVIRAPYHLNPKDFPEAAVTLAKYVAMMAVSVQTMEHAVKQARAAGSKRILIAGVSLGGAMTNRHHAHLNTADVYCPMFASPLMGDVFLDSAYSWKVSKEAKAKPDYIRQMFNFDSDWAKVIDANVFPLLAKHDGYIPFNHHKAAYRQRPVVAVYKGHITGILNGKLLRQHIEKHLST